MNTRKDMKINNRKTKSEIEKINTAYGKIDITKAQYEIMHERNEKNEMKLSMYIRAKCICNTSIKHHSIHMIRLRIMDYIKRNRI